MSTIDDKKKLRNKIFQSEDMFGHILSFVLLPAYTFRKEVIPQIRNSPKIYMNPRVIYTLEHTPMEKWDIMYMVQNSNIEILPYVEKYIMKNFEQVKKMKYVKSNVSKNPIMVPLLEKYPELICWTSISGNRAAYHIIKKNMHKIKL